MHEGPCFTQIPTQQTFGMQVDCTVQPGGLTDVNSWNPAFTCQDRIVSPGQPRNYSSLDGKCFPADRIASERNYELKNKVTARTHTKTNGCPTPNFLKLSPAIHSLKLLLISSSLIRKPPYVPMTNLVGLISKHKDTRKGGAGKRLRHHFAHVARTSARKTQQFWFTSFSELIFPAFVSSNWYKGKNLSYQFLRSRQLGWNNGLDICEMSGLF